MPVTKKSAKEAADDAAQAAQNARNESEKPASEIKGPNSPEVEQDNAKNLAKVLDSNTEVKPPEVKPPEQKPEVDKVDPPQPDPPQPKPKVENDPPKKADTPPAPQPMRSGAREVVRQPEFTYLDLSTLSSYVDMGDGGKLYQKKDVPFKLSPKKAQVLLERMDDRAAPVFKIWTPRPATRARTRSGDNTMEEGQGDMHVSDLKPVSDTAEHDTRTRNRASANRTDGVEV